MGRRKTMRNSTISCTRCGQLFSNHKEALAHRHTVTKYQITRSWDGGKDCLPFVVITLNSENECFEWIHDHTPFSFHEAMTNQGYAIRPVEVTA
jgi:hypothetical protein